ncbi:MAG TPA: hypothetical protein VH063_05155 [Gaiellaceae bacterium]|jgi:hypothetical protein|nr:hypothetical protein [Gaiellaceae bacterium]
MLLAVSVLSDLLVPIVLAFTGTAVAALWPSIQGYRRRRRLTALVKRELREIGPLEPAEGKDWWEHLDKRFIHEEFFRRENVVQNRDFLLSLPPSLVYHASQLWIAYDKQDLDEWRWHLRRLIEAKELAGALATKESRHALERWDHFAKDGPTVPKAATADATGSATP